MLKNRLALLIGIFSFAFAAKAITTKTHSVQARNGFACDVHLTVPSSKTIKGIFYQRSGTGQYSMGEVSPQAQKLIDQEQIARLVVDRPGITYDAKAPEKFRSEQTVYTLSAHLDLVTCTEKAINWAMEQPELAKVPVVLMGHSEGSEIVSKTYLRLLQNESPWLPQIKALILSGSPMIPLKDVILRQLSPTKRKAFWNAMKKRDDKYLMATSGLSSNYLKSYLKEPSQLSYLQQLISLKTKNNKTPKISLEFFHGLDDDMCAVKPIRDFEKQNGAPLENLVLRMHYYGASHTLNEAAQDDMIATMLRHLKS